MDAIGESRGVKMQGALRLTLGSEEDVEIPGVPLLLHGVRLNQVPYQYGTDLMVTISVTVGLRYLANELDEDPHQVARDSLRALDGLAASIPVKFKWLDSTDETVDDEEWRQGTWGGIDISHIATTGTTLEFVEVIQQGGRK